ncbi:phage gene 29 protein family protein [Tsukamurella ocularis]|uniref:phage gene 29 protein family protein n=1 Tax=Tsukamurella ocularis TaxID=1970234 RepID=UPI0039F078DC
MPNVTFGPDTFPTRENCNLDDPEEMFLWLLVGAPMITGGALPFTTGYLRMLSKHWWELGAMIRCPECGHEPGPRKHLEMPAHGGVHQLYNPPVWKDGPYPEGGTQADKLDAVVENMSPYDRSVLIKKLTEANNTQLEGGAQ